MPAQRHDVRPEDALVGTTVGGFRILSLVNRNIEGTTSYRVADPDTDEPATLRLAPADEGSGLAERFGRDARLLAGLEHASLPAVVAIGEAPEGAYVVTAESHGRSLAAVLASGLPPEQAVRMLEDVGRALDVAHGAGLLHRAVTPSNIVVGEWLIVRPLLTNFVLGHASRESGAGVDDEHAPYASPEELRGEPVGPEADRYGLACTLFEVLAGAPPFGSASDAAIHGHLHAPPPRLTDLRADADPALDAVLQRALAKEPEERYGSAGQLTSDTSRALLEGIAPDAAAAVASAHEPLAAPAAPPEPELPSDPESEPPVGEPPAAGE